MATKGSLRALISKELLEELSCAYKQNEEFSSFSVFIETLLFLGLQEVKE